MTNYISLKETINIKSSKNIFISYKTFRNNLLSIKNLPKIKITIYKLIKINKKNNIPFPKQIKINETNKIKVSKNCKLKAKYIENLLKYMKISVKSIKDMKMKMKLYKIIHGNQQMRKMLNKKQKTINGNTKNKIRIISFNKADENIAAKMNNINQIIIKQKPQILIVNELNLRFNQYSGITNIKGYNFITDVLINSKNNVRIGMWISKNLKITRNPIFDDNKNHIIAIKVGYPKTKKINIIRHYRQFKDQQSQKRDNKEEKKQFEIITNKIAKINDNNEEVIYIGDINIDLTAINLNENLKTQTQKGQNGLMKILKDNIIDKGFTLMNKEKTFLEVITLAN